MCAEHMIEPLDVATVVLDSVVEILDGETMVKCWYPTYVEIISTAVVKGDDLVSRQNTTTTSIAILDQER